MTFTAPNKGSFPLLRTKPAWDSVRKENRKNDNTPNGGWRGSRVRRGVEEETASQEDGDTGRSIEGETQKNHQRWPLTPNTETQSDVSTGLEHGMSWLLLEPAKAQPGQKSNAPLVHSLSTLTPSSNGQNQTYPCGDSLSSQPLMMGGALSVREV